MWIWQHQAHRGRLSKVGKSLLDWGGRSVGSRCYWSGQGKSHLVSRHWWCVWWCLFNRQGEPNPMSHTRGICAHIWMIFLVFCFLFMLLILYNYIWVVIHCLMYLILFVKSYFIFIITHESCGLVAPSEFQWPLNQVGISSEYSGTQNSKNIPILTPSNGPPNCWNQNWNKNGVCHYYQCLNSAVTRKRCLLAMG